MTTLTSTAAAKPRLSTFRQAMLSFFWFATSAHWAAILVVLLPAQALQIGGDEFKGRGLALILALGALVSMVVAPFFGALSDRTRLPLGRRRPWLIVGALMNAVGLVALATIPTVPSSLFLFSLAFMWVEFWNNFATAPYSALIPDVVPPEQRGSASGWLGLMTILGTFLGGLAGLFLTTIGITNLYFFLIAIILLGMIATVAFIREPAAPAQLPRFRWGEFLRGLYRPLRDSPDFRWVVLTRLIVIMGQYTVQVFLLYYFTDVVKDFRLFGMELVPDAGTAVTVFLSMLLFGAMVSTLQAGVLSDRYGRKLMVYIAGALQGIVALVLVFSNNFELAVLMGIVFGLGYGAYQSVDWALATDVLPSMDDYAKDMGVWHVADVFPQVIATPIAGILLDVFQMVGKSNGMPTLGYSVIFAISALYFLLGTVFVRLIRGVR
ncbi:MAG: MFS transporter [Rudaea sp.]